MYDVLRNVIFFFSCKSCVYFCYLSLTITSKCKACGFVSGGADFVPSHCRLSGPVLGGGVEGGGRASNSDGVPKCLQVSIFMNGEGEDGVVCERAGCLACFHLGTQTG